MKIRNTLLRGAICAVMAAILLSFCACNAQELSSLRTFASPQVGAYECTYAKFGRRDVFEDFREITLTLESGGAFTLSAVQKTGKVEKARGKYEYDDESETLYFLLQTGRTLHRRACVVQNGKFVFSETFAGIPLVLKFQAKI